MNKCLLLCMNVSRAIPLVFIFLIIAWSYYAYVVAMCIYAIPSSNIGEKVALIVFYHIFLGMFLWAYIQTVFTKPALVPLEFKLTPPDMASIEPGPLGHDAEWADRRREYLLALVSQRRLPIFTRGGGVRGVRGVGGEGNGVAIGGSSGFSSSGAVVGSFVRICDTCQLIKPDRAHHCSTCGVCLLKMDHHCPWVNNCVGLHNYKFFLLFLTYGAVYCCYVGGSSAQYFAAFWTAGMSDVQAYRFHVLFVFFAAWLFSLSLLFLAGYHAFLTLRNRTTLESSRAPILESGPDEFAFDLGPKRNFFQVFGDRWQLWLLPIKSWCVDGTNWELRRGSPSWEPPLSPASVRPTLLRPGESRLPDADIEGGS